MSSQAILILGAGGFVGKHLVKRLSSAGHPNIHALGRHIQGLPPLPGVTYHQASLDDVTALRRLLPQCSSVIHAASESTPGFSALRPAFEAEHNLLPSLRFLEILQDYCEVRLIYLSTGGALYGNPDPANQLVKEDLAAMPLSYYGAGKAALEHFIFAFCEQQQRPGIILRPANLYGPEQPYKPGFGIVPTIFQHLRQNQPIQIWGDGEAVRDYLYIEDFIDLCMSLITSAPAHGSAVIYNVGSQQGTSLNQLCRLIEQVTKMTVRREHHDPRAVDVRRIVLDCSRIHNDYGWWAKTSLSHGLHLSWEWFNSHQGQVVDFK